MVEVPSQLYGVYQYAASWFQIRPEWLIYPNLVTIFIWPLVLNVFMFYYILNKMVRIFPGGINYILAGILAFLALPYNQYTSLVAPLVIGIWGINWSGAAGIFGRILIMGLLYGMTFYILPWATSFRF